MGKINRVVILGAGPAGLAAARVALFEYGAENVEVYDQGKHEVASYSSCLKSLPNFQFPTGGFGGSTSAGWGGQLAKLSDESLAFWQSEEGGFTEEAIKGLMTASAQLASDFGLLESDPESSHTNPIFHGGQGAQINKKYTCFPKEKNLEVIYDDVITNPRFSLFEGRIRKINTHGSEIQLQFGEWEREIPNDCLLVIALGCIETTNLILRSFPEASTEAQIGIGLRDHPSTYLYTFSTKRFATNVPDFRSPESFKTKYEVGQVSINGFKKKSIFEVREIYNQEVINGQLHVKKLSPLRYFQNKTKSVCRRALPNWLFNSLFIREFVVWAQVEQISEKSNYLKIQEDILMSTWQLRSSDIESFRYVADVSREWLRSFDLQLNPVVNLDSLSNLSAENFQAAHPSGTIKVSNEKKNTIANCSGKMHAFPNIVIASSAIFPSDGWENPTLTIMAHSISAVRTALDIEIPNEIVRVIPN